MSEPAYRERAAAGEPARPARPPPWPRRRRARPARPRRRARPSAPPARRHAARPLTLPACRATTGTSFPASAIPTPRPSRRLRQARRLPRRPVATLRHRPGAHRPRRVLDGLGDELRARARGRATGAGGHPRVLGLHADRGGMGAVPGRPRAACLHRPRRPGPHHGRQLAGTRASCWRPGACRSSTTSPTLRITSTQRTFRLPPTGSRRRSPASRNPPSRFARISGRTLVPELGGKNEKAAKAACGRTGRDGRRGTRGRVIRDRRRRLREVRREPERLPGGSADALDHRERHLHGRSLAGRHGDQLPAVATQVSKATCSKRTSTSEGRLKAEASPSSCARTSATGRRAPSFVRLRRQRSPERSPRPT